MAAVNNQFFDVEGYVADEALPELESLFSMAATFDTQFEDWEKVEKYGTRGNKFAVKRPARINTLDTLSFNATTSGQYDELSMTVVADQFKSAPTPISSDQLATYNPESFLSDIGRGAIASIVTKVEAFCCQRAAFTGYRFMGSPDVPVTQLQTFTDLTVGLAKFRAYGGDVLAHCHLPIIDSAKITQSGLQQFATKRNDEIAINGEIGELTGVYNTRFYQNALLPIHTSGTASAEGEIEISAVADSTATDPFTGETVNTTTISLTNMTDATATVVQNDLLDVGALQGLKYLTYIGYENSEVDVQARVITGGTAAGGDLDIVVYPRLTFDATNTNTERNLPRAIATGAAGDKVRIVKSHRCGTVFLKDYMKFVAPKLPHEDPYKTGTYMDPDTKVSLRAYSGSVLGGNTHQFVHDIMYGANGAAEGVMRICLPL